LIVLTQTGGVYCAVRTELLNTIQVYHSIDAPYGFSSLISETNGRSLGNFKRQAMYVYRNIERRWCEQCCSGKGIIITYSEFVFVVLVIQHALRMRLIFHMWFAWLSKGLHSILKNDFRGGKKVIECKSIKFSVQLLSETFRILRNERGMIKNAYCPSCTVPVILVRF